MLSFHLHLHFIRHILRRLILTNHIIILHLTLATLQFPSLMEGSLYLLAFSINIQPLPMLLTIHPLPLIPSAIRPCKHPLSFLLILSILTHILLTIRPAIHPMSFHHVTNPSSFVTTTIWPCKFTFSFNCIFLELSFVR